MREGGGGEGGKSAEKTSWNLLKTEGKREREGKKKVGEREREGGKKKATEEKVNNGSELG